MKTFLVLTFLFAVGSIGGWLLEFFFRRIVHKHWMNPGFLQGPYLPLYGFGLVGLFLIAEIPLPIEPVWLKYVLQMLIVCVAMTGIEYIAGLIFIKGMGIKLWDYTDRKGNIQGIICPLFSVIWTVIGGVYVIFCHKTILGAVQWFTGNLYYSFFVGVTFGLLVWDLVATLNLSTKIRAFAKEHEIVVKYEEFKEHVRAYFNEKKSKYNFMKPLKASAETLKEVLLKYAENVKKSVEELKKKNKKNSAAPLENGSENGDGNGNENGAQS